MLAHAFAAIISLGGSLCAGYMVATFLLWYNPNYWLVGLYSVVSLFAFFAFVLIAITIWKKEHRLWDKDDDFFHKIFDKHFDVDKDE